MRRSFAASGARDFAGRPRLLRLALAASALLSSKTRPGQIARHVGYDSESAFNRAFKRAYGVPPQRWRRSGMSQSQEKR